MYELTGKVKRIGELQTFASGFTKREVVIERPGGERGPIPTPVVFKGDDVSLVERADVGRFHRKFKQAYPGFLTDR